MAQSVLGSITLCYRPLWGRTRTLAGVQLFAHEDDGRIDGHHLLRTLAELGTSESPPLLLTAGTPQMLLGLLSHAGAADPLIDVPARWLDGASLRAELPQAVRRGARLVLSGAPAQVAAYPASGFDRTLLSLSADDAAAALQAVLRRRQSGEMLGASGPLPGSPVRQRAVVDGVASRALADHALDQQGAWAVAGWPDDDVLHRHRGQPLPPTHAALQRTLRALDEEQSLERIEQLFGEEPTLAYRLLLHLNSASMGLRNGIASLRHGVMMLGFRTLAGWLAEQLPHACEDADIAPVNAAMVLRAQLMTHLMEAGIEEELRREVYLCGLFAQLDAVMDEPLRVSLNRIPLPERVPMAILRGTGPYAPCLQIAQALGSGNPDAVRALREASEFAAEDVNRALLRTLVLAL